MSTSVNSEDEHFLRSKEKKVAPLLVDACIIFKLFNVR